MREMKDSGIEWIGEIPKKKQFLRNKYMFSYEKGKLPFSINLDKRGFAYIGASDLDSSINEYSTYTEDESLPNAEYNDLLVLWDGARAGLCGTHKIGKLSSTIVRIKADETVYQPFLYWYYKGFEDFMYQSVSGTTIPHMNRRYIENIGFIDWTIQEQQKISAYLDTKCTKIDSIIEKQEKVIEKLKAYKLSVITETVTKGLNPDVKMKDSGIEWIGEIPKHWMCINLIRTADKNRTYAFGDGDHGLIKTEDYKTEGIPFIRVQNIGWCEELDLENVVYISERDNQRISNSTLRPGDILFVKTGGTIGKTGIIPESLKIANTTSHVGKISISPRFCNKYILYLLSSHVGYRQFWAIASQKATRPELGLEEIKTVKITVPPNKNEQKEIADYLDKKCSAIDSIIEKKQALIEKLTEYKKSLIYEVVTGKKEVYNPKRTVTVFCPVGIPTNEEEYAKILLIQKIITRCGKNLKGRIHLMKIFHALEIEMGFSFHSEYTRYTHGPYDKKIEKYESELVRKGWISLKKGKKVEYIVVNSTEYKTDYNRIFSKYNKEINRIIDFFKQMTRTSKAEKVATLLASWNDFLIDGMAEPTDDMIINDVMNNWTDNKKNTPYETWLEILNQMRKAKIVPHGYGRHTIKMED